MPAKTPRRILEHRRAIAATAIVAFACVISLVVLCLENHWRYSAYQPQEGDVIFQSLPGGPLTSAIEGGTHSPWSHCGIVAKDNHGNWVVYEALGEVGSVRLPAFLDRSRDGSFAVYRWKIEWQPRVPAMLEHVRASVGKPYDYRYRLDDEAIYCSELIYKACLAATGEPAGALVKLGELDWQPHRALIEQLEGGPVPVDRRMITPRDLAKAEQLELVYEP